MDYMLQLYVFKYMGSNAVEWLYPPVATRGLYFPRIKFLKNAQI